MKFTFKLLIFSLISFAVYHFFIYIFDASLKRIHKEQTGYSERGSVVTLNADFSWNNVEETGYYSDGGKHMTIREVTFEPLLHDVSVKHQIVYDDTIERNIYIFKDEKQIMKMRRYEGNDGKYYGELGLVSTGEGQETLFSYFDYNQNGRIDAYSECGPDESCVWWIAIDNSFIPILEAPDFQNGAWKALHTESGISWQYDGIQGWGLIEN